MFFTSGILLFAFPYSGIAQRLTFIRQDAADEKGIGRLSPETVAHVLNVPGRIGV